MRMTGHWPRSMIVTATILAAFGGQSAHANSLLQTLRQGANASPAIALPAPATGVTGKAQKSPGTTVRSGQDAMTGPALPTGSDAALPTNFVMNPAGDGWRFLMGPAGGKHEAALFYRMPSAHGGVSILCRRGMTDGVVVKLAKAAPAVKAPMTVTIAIGKIHHDLAMRPGPHGRSLIFQGPAGIAMLRVFAGIPAGRTDRIRVTTQSGTLLAALPTPVSGQTALAAAEVCLGWIKPSTHRLVPVAPDPGAAPALTPPTSR